MALDPATQAVINRALGAIQNRAFAPYVDQTRLTKLAPQLSGRELERVFRVPNNFLIPYAAAHPGQKNNARAAQNVSAMTNADSQNPDERMIYFKENPPKFGTVVHELFHWLSHRDFYTGFHMGSEGPNVGTVDEGITEFLTRKITAEDRTQHYQAEYLEVRQLCSDRSVEERVLQTYFKGGGRNIGWLKDHVRNSRRRGIR